MRIGMAGFRDLGFTAREIRLTGGGAKSPLWQHIAADIMNLPVVLPAGDEAAAMGGAIQALWCLEKAVAGGGAAAGDGAAAIEALAGAHVGLAGGRTIQPDPAAVAAYDKAYAEYEKYLSALGPLYR
jgi:xylulokinase